jgi:spore germination protein YaaH
MLSPRAGALAAAAGVLSLLSACAPTTGDVAATQGAGGGLVIVTTGGAALVDGQDDVPPTLDLRVVTPSGVTAQQVQARLDGSPLPLTSAPGAVTATVKPMPLGSSHTLDLAMPDRDPQHIAFHVAPPAGAAAAFFTGPHGATLDVAFQFAPSDQAAVASAIPGGARAAWSNPTHLQATWPSAPGGTFGLPAGLATARGSHLAAALDLSLGPLAPGQLRRTAVPAPQHSSGKPVVVAFTVGTAASRASLAAHADRISVVSPTGIHLNSDGSLSGSPDTTAVAAAAAHDVPVWPLIQNDASDTAGIQSLLADPGAVSAFVQAAAALGYPGVHLDIEGVPADSRDRLTALVQGLAGALHRDGRKLAVAIVPHKPGHLNEFSAAYDVQAIAAAADLVTLMAYDQHTGLTDPGPVAGLDWDRQVLAGSLAEMGSPATGLLGLPLYSRAWEGGDATADAYASSVSHALGTPGAEVDYDFNAATPLIRYGPDATLYFDDAQSLAAKASLVESLHLRGVALWRLGFEDPAVWNALPLNPPRP